VVCGEDFTRNSSAKRHKRIVHQGNCLIVRHIEYVAGRASGLYPEPRTPPRMSRKRKIIKFQQGNNDNNTQLQHPTPPFPISDIIADEVWCGNAPESIIYSQPKTKWNNYIINKIESETEKLDPVDKALTIVRKGVEFKNLLEELSATKPKQQQQQINPLTEYYNFRGTPFYVPSNQKAYSRDIEPIDKTINQVRKLVEFKSLCEQLSSYANYPHPNNLPGFGNFNAFNPTIVQERLRSYVNDILRKTFGFRMHFCPQCLALTMNPVRYPEKEKEITNDVILHSCQTEHVIAANAIRFQQYDDFHNSALEFVMKSLSALSTGSFNHLVAIPLFDYPEEILKLTNPVNPAIPISFLYSKEKHVEIDLDKLDQNNYNNNNSHFLTRVLSKQQTELTNEELLEFLKLVKTATFAFFKVKTKGSWHYYFMTLRN